MNTRGAVVRRLSLVVGGVILGIFVAFPWSAVADRTVPRIDAVIGPEGEYRDLVIDEPRGRLYATNAMTWDAEVPVGVVVFDLETRSETARIPISSPTGIALSPSGARLAVGSSDGSLRIVDPDTLTIASSQSFSDALIWDVVFDGEDRLLAGLGSSYITCEGAILLVNLPLLSEAGRLADPGCGTPPWAQLRVDPSRDRLYVLGSGVVSVYDLSTASPTLIMSKRETGFSGRGVLSPDGGRLVLSSGFVFDAINLTFLADVNRTGEVSLDSAGTKAYFATAPFVNEVRLSDYAALVRYAFDGVDALGPLTVESTAVDSVRSLDYVIVARGTSANFLKAVPLVPGIVDPYPSDGSVLSWNEVVGAYLSGGIDPASVQLTVDGTTLVHQYAPQMSRIYHVSPTPWAEGVHSVVVTGTDAGGAPHTLAWSFTIDNRPPEITVETLAPMYRAPTLTIRGRILDAHLGGAMVNSQPVILEPSGDFTATLPLNQGGNLLYIRTYDQAGNEGSWSTWVLHVPPTTRYRDSDGRFSIEYPSNWSLQVDEVVGDFRLDAVVSDSSGANANMIAVNDPANATESGLWAAAQDVYAAASQTSGFTPHQPPGPYEIPGLLAVTYAYEVGWGPGRVFQRQVLVANTTERLVWVLTFTAPYWSQSVYDPLFLWMASSFLSESLDESGSGSPASADPFGVLPYILVAIGTGAAILGLVGYLGRKNRAGQTPPTIPPPLPQQSSPPP
jgi:hypothetical protein